MKCSAFHHLTILLAVMAISATCLQAQIDTPYDIVILNGRVVDGTGNAWFLGDVAIRGERIARIAPAGILRDARAREKIDAAGLIVAPGFIDIQSHSREPFLVGDGRVIGKVTQGVTTEILGEAWTNAPANDFTIEYSLLNEPEEVAARAKEFTGPHSFDKWLRTIQQRGLSTNVGSFVGATTVRACAKGMAQGPPTAQELETMRRVVRESMEDGAFGFASALIYPPGNFAGTEELIEMAKAMRPYGGVYITHIRSEADRFIEALDEAIEIGREGQVPVEVYHLKAAGVRNWHKASLAIARIEAVRSEGLDISANMYPYQAGGAGLAACLPPWASADGKLYENLADPQIRAKIRADILNPAAYWENLCELGTAAGTLVLGLQKPENRAYVGKRLSEIAAAMGRDWIEATMELIHSEGRRIDGVYFFAKEDNLKLQMQQPWIKFGTDAGGWDPANPKGLVHPRSYGTYPRILGKYVREERVLPLEEAIRKMTSAVATRLSIRDRGLLREHFFADITVFDPDSIMDRATYEQPHQLSVGVRHVFVNGQAVVKNGEHTGATPGQIVRGPGYAAVASGRSR